MNPYLTERLAEEHRSDLPRSGQTYRLTRQLETTTLRHKRSARLPRRRRPSAMTIAFIPPVRLPARLLNRLPTSAARRVRLRSRQVSRSPRTSGSASPPWWR